MSSDEIALIMKAYAKDAVKFAESNGVELDYTEESLAQVDALILRLKEKGSIPVLSKKSEAELWRLSKMIGGYVGEVVLLTIGGQWKSEVVGESGEQVFLDVDGLKAFPTEKAWKLITKDEYDYVGGYVRAIHKIIESREK
jgi:hypothetical protein